MNLGQEEKDLIQGLKDELAAAGSDTEKMVVCQARIAVCLTILAYKVGRKIK